MSRRRIAVYAVGAAVLGLFGGRWAAIQYTEASWYADLGLSSLYWNRLTHDVSWHLAVAAAATLWYAAQTFAVYWSIGAVHLPRRVGNLEIAEAVPRRVLRWVALGIAVVLGVVTAATFTDVPELVSLYRAAAPLALREPVLGRDAAFYLARLPLLETLHLAALLLVLFGAFVALALYAMTGSVTFAERRLRATPHARTHMVSLLAALALVVAWGFQLDAYAIVGGGGGAGGALVAADRAIRIPACHALAALALVVAAGSAAALRRARNLLVVAMWGTLAVAAVLGRFVVPFLSGVWGRGPSAQEAAALTQYADRYSRAGLGVLRDIEAESLAAAPEAPAESLAALGRELGGVSPWDGEPELLDAALSAALPDSARPRTWTATLEPYTANLVGAAPVFAALAVPETDEPALARMPGLPDWTALHRGPLSWAGPPVALLAEPGEGGALRYLTALESGGRADTSADPAPLGGASGPLRYLARASGTAVVGPSEAPPAAGPRGLRLGGIVRRLLFAWALQAPPLLDRRTSAADRVLIWRDVPRRLERLYPFASFDSPRAVLVDGEVTWLADGYLASARFPLADHVTWDGDEVNFLRAAYLATVDAATGATRLYLRPPDLPLAASIAAAMGAPALPSDGLGPGLRRHLGYPRELLVAQAEMIARHRGDTGAGAGPWTLAVRAGDTASGGPPPPHPTLALLRLDGTPRLWRLLPLADDSGNALVALLAATTLADGTPRLRLLRLRPGTFPTVAAAESRISLAPAVVGAMAQASGPAGNVRRGPVAVVPAGGTVAYVEYLFSSPRRAEQPLLPRQVAVLEGGRLGVGDDVGSAARALAATGASARVEAAVSASLADARRAFLALDSAARAGDWVRFGRAYERLRQALGAPGSGSPRP